MTSIDDLCQKFKDLAKDADSLDTFIDGAVDENGDGTFLTKSGAQKKTLAKIVEEVTQDPLVIQGAKGDTGDSGNVTILPPVGTVVPEGTGLTFKGVNFEAVSGGSTVPNVISYTSLFDAGFKPKSVCYEGDYVFLPSVNEFESAKIDLPYDGEVYVGFDNFSKLPIILTRLGHRGWLPLAKVTRENGVLISLEKLNVSPYKSRLTKTIAKVARGEAVSGIIDGSSLAEGMNPNHWGGMLINESSDYQLPNTVITNNAVGGAPNKYGFARTGLINYNTSKLFSSSGFSNLIGDSTLPSGRSNKFANVDFAIITVLANGGEYRTSIPEAHIRNLIDLGVEVVLCTDSSDGAQLEGTNWGFDSLDEYKDSEMYRDGQGLIRLADKLGCELADTAAYVGDATLRYTNVDIYGDPIHMVAMNPNGYLSELPSGGSEIYARAVRSVFPIDFGSAIALTETYDFSNSQLTGTIKYGGSTRTELTVSGDVLRVEKKGSDGAWGVMLDIPNYMLGSTIRVTGEVVNFLNDQDFVNIGTQVGGGGWGSSVLNISSVGSFDITLNSTRDNDAAQLLFYPENFSAVDDQGFELRGITVEVIGVTPKVIRSGVEYEVYPRNKFDKYSDLDTPADAVITLPTTEAYLVSGDGSAGTLTDTILGTTFSDKVSEATGNERVLEVGAGKRCSIAAAGMVGCSMILASETGHGPCQYQIYQNNSLVKTETIPTQAVSRDVMRDLINIGEITPSLNQHLPNPTYEIRVVSGSLKISALIAWTWKIKYIKAHELTYVGDWTANPVEGGAPNMIGYGSDVAGSYATLNQEGICYFALSDKPNSKPVDIYSESTVISDLAITGVLHNREHGGLYGSSHTIKLKEDLTGTPSNGDGFHALHVGGAMVVVDR